MIVACHLAEETAAVNDLGVSRIGSDVTAFAAPHRIPIRGTDACAICAAGDRHCRVVLLRSVNAIWKLVVGDDVVKLPSGLVIQRGPALAPIEGNRAAA